MTPNALICTVGTSIFQNSPELRDLPVEQAASRLSGVFDPARAGAEYQSLSMLVRRRELLDPRVLYLFCSDTEEGEKAGRILERCFSGRFARIECTRCRDLRDDQPRLFVSRGLRSLVNALARGVAELRRQGYRPAIDATGGYKPQIAYATLVGQVLQVPVYYRHANFPDVVVLQPLPVALDVEVWFDQLWFLERLREELLPAKEIPPGDGRLVPLLDREDDLVTLSPLGELMAAAVDRLLMREEENLLPPPADRAPSRKKVTFEDGNAGKHRGLKAFCQRLVEVPFVTRVASFYYNPDLPGRTRVRVVRGADSGLLEVWYSEGTGTTKLRVWTTARRGSELAAARYYLARELGRES